MTRYKVRPWRDYEELLQVRKGLYLDNVPDNFVARRDACDTIEIWRRRLPLPHGISSSSLIVEAQLHHIQHGQKASPTALCAVYASALARFVTGFCDINQSSTVKRSMFDVAAGLGMSERWVELRHQITHGGELPSLAVLEHACEGAMGWLWQHFWSRFDTAAERSASREKVLADERSSLKSELRPVLKRFVDMRKGEVKSVRADTNATSSTAVSETLADIVALLGNQSAGADALSSLLVEEALIVPSKRSMGDSMAGAFLLWDAVLVEISLRIHRFLAYLAMQMVKAVTNATEEDETRDPYKEALELWLERILTSKAWKSRREQSADGLRALRQAVLQECVLAPGHWTRNLSQRILGAITKSIDGDWRDVCEAAALDEKEWDEDEEQVDLDSNGHRDIHPRTSGVDSDSTILLGGWRPAPGRWRRLPIGLSQSEAVA